MKRHFVHALLFVALFGSVEAASAVEDQSFSLGPASLRVTGTAVSSATIVLPKSGLSSFNISFVVPRDHAIDTRILVLVYMHQPTAGPCTAATRLGAVSRRRVGFVGTATGSPNIDRVEVVGGVEATTFAATGGVLTAKTYVVKTPSTGTFTRLRAGDSFDIRIDRVSTDGGDTCTAEVFVSSVDIRYTSVAAVP